MENTQLASERVFLSPLTILERPAAKDVVAYFLCALLWLVYIWIYLPFLPTAADTVGHDYSLHFPNLLTGYYWFLQNGFSKIPWFSPSQCGGFPYFPDPNVIYYSLTQFLVFAVPPIRAVQLTFLLLSFIGMMATYYLLRGSFQSSRIAAIVAAGLFLFNGFFAYRMLIGHLTFHAFALVPLMTAAVLPRVNVQNSLWNLGIRICVAGLCLTYMFSSGMVHGIPPALIAAAIIFLIHGLCFGWQLTPWILLGCAGFLALGLSASRLSAVLALLSNFARDDYPLPGIAGITNALWGIFQSLFLDISVHAPKLTNAQWVTERHEWEYGVSFAPLVIFAVFVVWAVARRLRRSSNSKTGNPRLDRVLAVLAILLLMATPIALNFYEPGWNAFLKALPYVKNSSTLFRFVSVYIPVLVVLAALALDRISFPSWLPHRIGAALLAAIALSVMLWQNLSVDRDYYAKQPYEIAPIEAEYARVNASQDVPAIESIGGRGNEFPNEAMIYGTSRLYCYQPLFGYRLEKFPRAPLQIGAVITPIGDAINLKNPACYLFPKENKCSPGDHFSIAQIDEAVAFMTYRPFSFVESDRQKFANLVSLTFWVAISIFLAFSFAVLLRRAWAGRPSGAAG